MRYGQRPELGHCKKKAKAPILNPLTERPQIDKMLEQKPLRAIRGKWPYIAPVSAITFSITTEPGKK